jgi:hypothetical protein
VPGERRAYPHNQSFGNSVQRQQRRPTLAASGIPNKNKHSARREGAGNFFQRNYSLKINRLLPSDRLRGRAGTLWSGSLQGDHSFAGRLITATHLLLLTVCCFEVATLLLGAAKADAQKTIDTATVAHRIDQPHKPFGLVTVVMAQGSTFSSAKASRNAR